MGQAEEFLKEIGQDGVLDSEGVFSYDASAACRKLKEYRLHDPDGYGVLLTRCVVSSGASDINIRVDSDDFEIRFQGGHLRPADFDQFSRGAWQDSWSLRYLLWAVQACQSIGVSWVRIHIDQQCWEFSADQVRKIPSSESGLIHAKRSFGTQVVTRFLLGASPEIDRIRAVYHHFAPRITVNGERLPLDPLPCRKSTLARFCHGSGIFDCDPKVVLLHEHTTKSATLCVDGNPPLGTVDLVVSWPGLHVEGPQAHGGVNVYLGGGFQERITLGFEESPFEFYLALEGLELDLSLQHVREGRSWEAWRSWLLSLEVPIFQILCEEQKKCPSLHLAGLVTDKFFDLLHRTRSQSEETLWRSLEAVPLFLSSQGQGPTAQQIREQTSPLSPSDGWRELEKSLWGMARPLVRAKLQTAASPWIEMLKHYPVYQPLDCSATPVPFSKDCLHQQFQKAHPVLLSDLKCGADLCDLGTLILNSANRTVTAEGVANDVSELVRFDIYLHQRHGPKKVEHKVLIRILAASRESLFSDVGVEYRNPNDEQALHYRHFQEQLDEFCRLAEANGAAVFVIDS